MVAFLPPSSSDSFLNVSLAATATVRPVTCGSGQSDQPRQRQWKRTVPPVNETASTDGDRMRGSPASLPNPNTKLATPGGSPTFTIMFASACAVNGLSSLGLQTSIIEESAAGSRPHNLVCIPTVQPIASAGASFHVSLTHHYVISYLQTMLHITNRLAWTVMMNTTNFICELGAHTDRFQGVMRAATPTGIR